MKKLFPSQILLFFAFFFVFTFYGCNGPEVRDKMGNIYLTKIGHIGIDLSQVSVIIAERFNVEVSIIDTLDDVEFAYDKDRRQYFSPAILSRLAEFVPKDGLRLLAIVGKDIYDHGLNFIFGEASGKVCIVSIDRFRPCRWKEKDLETKILIERTIKTVIHELGHTFGLNHCDSPKCVMFFSNWVGDTDRKSNDFCLRCKSSLK